MCSFMMIVLALHTLPPPYWCRDDDGNYLNGRGGRPSVVCNEEASTKGGEYAFLMMMAALGSSAHALGWRLIGPSVVAATLLPM